MESSPNTTSGRADDPDSVLGYTEVRYLHSSIVKDDFKLFIAHPVFPLLPEQKPQVLFVLDANSSFGIVVDTVRSMSLEGVVPPVLIVGIGYKSPWLVPDAFVKRSRDYTPTKIAKFDQHGHTLLPGIPQQDFETGGAPDFLRFIEEELKPYVAQEFNADTDESLITGVSLGGLFAFWVLLTQPGTFKRYLVSSPSLWWDKEHLLKLGEKYISEKEDLPARVFVGCGDLERNVHFGPLLAILGTSNPVLGQLYGGEDGLLNENGELKMAEYLEEFLPKLQKRAFPSLKLDVKVFQDESHGSVYGAVLVRGLRKLFAKE